MGSIKFIFKKIFFIRNQLPLTLLLIFIIGVLIVTFFLVRKELKK